MHASFRSYIVDLIGIIQRCYTKIKNVWWFFREWRNSGLSTIVKIEAVLAEKIEPKVDVNQNESVSHFCRYPTQVRAWDPLVFVILISYEGKQGSRMSEVR